MSRLIRAKEVGLIGVILVLGILLASLGGTVRRRLPDPDHPGAVRVKQVNKFLQSPNLDNVIKNCSWTAIMAVGATIVIITGGIDLSVGAVYCLAAVSGAMFLRWCGPTGAFGDHSPGWSVPLGLLITVGIGTLCGVANGLMVVLLRVHPFIITLGTMSIYRGIAFVTTKAQSVTDFPPGFGTGFKSALREFTLVPMIIVAVVVLCGEVFLRHSVPGREVYAVGGNELASRFSGLRVGRVKLLVFTLAGLTAGIAATIALGLYGAAASSDGLGYELDVIAAAVVGGASLSGGRGTALGALLGALIIQLIANGIVILDIDQNYTRIIQGTVIILAVLLDRFSTSLSERRLVKG